MLQMGDAVFEEKDIAHWRPLLKLSAIPTAREIALASLSAGDSVLFRIHYHTTDPNYIVNEQMDKNTGF